MEWTKYQDQAVELAMTYLPQLLLALVFLFVGWIAIKVFVRILQTTFEKAKMEKSLRGFLLSVASVSLKILLVISVAGMVGIKMTSFIAVLGAAGLAVGLAFQGSLSNFAGGILLLSRKPFKVGDYIQAMGHSGTVTKIDILFTRMETREGELIIIPNGKLTNTDLINYSMTPNRRLELVYGIDYDDDIGQAQDVLEDIIESEERILDDPAPKIQVESLGGSSVNMRALVWVENDDWWSVKYDMNETVKKRFDQEGLQFPYPQQDVHLDQVEDQEKE